MDNIIESYDRQGLLSLMEDLGEPQFRARQLYGWLYQKGVSSYEDMTNLSRALRLRLQERTPLVRPEIIQQATSSDGTKKLLLRLSDGAIVETVGIPSENDGRLTVCFSTQSGCPMACSFCATGKEGLNRNLLIGEIVEQVLLVQQAFECRVSNVVAMGQGEPFLNYDNTIEALRILNDKKAMGIGARHITISSCGIIPGIERLAREPEQFTLAVSLHSALQDTRDRLMPKVAKYPLTALKKSLSHYILATKRRVTFEYIMIDGVNDGKDALKALLQFCDDLLCHVNLIPINAVEGQSFQPSDRKTIRNWLETIQRNGLECTLRHSKGSDIFGACGQLKNTYIRQH